MSKDKAIYMTTVGGEQEWVHASSQGNTVKLRWFGRDPLLERLDLNREEDRRKWDKLCTDGKRFSIGEIATRTARLGFSATKLNVETDADRWTEVFQCLREIGGSNPQTDIPQTTNVVPVVAGAEAQAPIPLTRMRRFYETLRMLNKSKLQQGIADYLSKKGRADRIQVIFQESESHFQRYKNDLEPFHDRKKVDWWAAYLHRPQQFAKCTVARLRPKNDNPVGVANWGDVRVVDYEISPFRTTAQHAVFEDGTSGSGGGMDLLLQDSETKIPIVGEIKASTDRELFLALIQSLTYATELTTRNQLKRLVSAYGKFAFETTDQRCDVFLIYDKRRKPPKLMGQTQELATQLLARATSPVASRIRRIAMVSADLEAEGGIALTCEWSTAKR